MHRWLINFTDHLHVPNVCSSRWKKKQQHRKRSWVEARAYGQGKLAKKAKAPTVTLTYTAVYAPASQPFHFSFLSCMVVDLSFLCSLFQHVHTCSWSFYPRVSEKQPCRNSYSNFWLLVYKILAAGIVDFRNSFFFSLYYNTLPTTSSCFFTHRVILWRFFFFYYYFYLLKKVVWMRNEIMFRMDKLEQCLWI